VLSNTLRTIVAIYTIVHGNISTQRPRINRDRRAGANLSLGRLSVCVVWSLVATQKAALLALFGGVVLCGGLSVAVCVCVCVGVALGAAATDLFRVSNRQLSHLLSHQPCPLKSTPP
jgi:hypothetical protein